MADIVIGIAASHTTLMNTQWAKVDHLRRAHNFRNGLLSAGAKLKRAAPDIVVILGSNHFRGLWLDMMPAFTIGIDEVICAGEHGTPKGPLRTEPATANYICEELLRRRFDVAFSSRLTIDHGISHAAQWILRDLDAPVVPIVINCFAPPLPSLARAGELGAALGEAIASWRSSKRIAIIASGGLSHALPFPDWRSPRSDDEHYIANSWREGRNRWEDFEKRRREIIVNAQPVINEEFDRWFLDQFETEGLRNFASQISDGELARKAGNGGAEIRMWIALAAALNHREARTLCYCPMPEWLTGMAVAVV